MVDLRVKYVKTSRVSNEASKESGNTYGNPLIPMTVLQPH